MPRIINSYFILLGGLGITLFNIYCYIENVWSFGYTKGQFLFLGICLCLSYVFPHHIDAVRESDTNKPLSFKEMQKKLRAEIQDKYGEAFDND
tara:strand:- start:61 stop:339 length:279 start_codon:yes stop_codon:yes gene_type:complete